jgi:hypothetical protein
LWAELDEVKRRKKISKAKSWLNRDAVSHMTVDLLAESDDKGDIIDWLRITSIVRQES